MSNECVAPSKVKEIPLALGVGIGLTTSVLAGCSMMPSLPTNNTIGRVSAPSLNKAPVKVRHATAIGSADETVNNPLPLVVNQAPQNNKPATNAKVNSNGKLLAGSKGKLWNSVIEEDEDSKLFDDKINTNNEALARIEVERQRWLTAQRNSLATSLKSAPNYLHYLIGQADIHNLPRKLTLLPLIESGYNPRAGKNLGISAPAGLWQISIDLAKALKLKMNENYDGRYDIKASTNTAYTYLGGLNRKYKNDWALTLAAYNGGTAVVDKAIEENKAQGKPTDFWSLNLPKETMEYVPRFLALTDIIANSERYGVKLPFVDEVRQLQFVRVNKGTKLEMVAPIASVPLDTLKALNAGLLLDRVNEFTPMDIVLPFLVPADIIKQLEQLPINYTYNTPYIPPLDQPYERYPSGPQPMIPNPNQPVVNRDPRYDVRQGNRFEPQSNTYVVQSGDTLLGVAYKLGIPRTVLARLNKVDIEYRLKEGEVLKLTPDANPNMNMGNVSANYAKKNPRRKPNRHLPKRNNVSNTGHYVVKAGDTLSGIAKMYHTSVRAIASLNHGVDTEYHVKTGETLTVPVKNPRKAIAKQPRRPVLVRTSDGSGKYQVISGDSLYSVARKFGLTQDQLARANNMDREEYLFTGQKITIPVNTSRPMSLNKQIQASASKPPRHKSPRKKFQRAKGVTNYRVQSGDSLTKLSRRYNVTLQTLAKMNGISPLDNLYTGTTIKVPNTAPSRDVIARNSKTVAGHENYKVKKGEGLIKLAERFGISANELAKMNGISATADLRLGQELIIPSH